MGDNRTTALPEGTDTVIEGAARIVDGGTATVEDTAVVTQRENRALGGDAGGTRSAETGTAGGANKQGSIVDRFRSGGEQLSSQAGEKARGFVSQGLDRTSEALANVARMVGDTAPGIEERLGPEYGEYARRAAGSIENVANTIASKDPDELIEDTRNFVRNSPGIALAGAAVLGFVAARLLKTGLAASNNHSEDDER